MTQLNPAYWDKKYQDQETPWDLSDPTPELLRITGESWFPKKGQAIVPGGGRGFDAILLAQKGLQVDLVDFSPLALDAALAKASTAKTAIYAYRQDFFSLSEAAFHQGRYDLFWEYTFFCAIDPSLRKEYVSAAAKLLKPGGLLVALFFPLETDKPGPPFLVSRQEIEKIFSPHFELHFEEPKASVKPRAGREILGIFKRLKA